MLLCVKVKFTLEQTTKTQRYNYTLSLTSALDGVGGQRHAPAALLPGKTRYPLHKRLGGPQGDFVTMKRSGSCAVRSHQGEGFIY